MTDAAALKEAVNDFRSLIEDPYMSLPIERYKASLRAIFAAAEAHLSTLPRTRMVEVWRVEWAVKRGNGEWRACADHFDTETRANAQALSFERDAFHCIRVTGPHTQEVPEA